MASLSLASATPAFATGEGTGQCRYSCTFGVTAPIRTATTCTAGPPSSCSASALAADCTRAGLVPSTSVQCVNGTGGSKCVINCTRPTTASPEELGTCSGAADAEVCSTRCDVLCAGRGMVCASGATCGAGGRCAFSCEVATTVTAPSEPSLHCDVAQPTASAQQCEARCIAYCGEHGGVCANSPAPTCVAGTSGTSSGTAAAGSDSNTPPTRPPQISRTAPVFSVEFPDPFGGNMKLPQVIGNLVRILVGLCGVFFLGVFVYGGVQYLMSAGDAKMVQKGQQAIVNAVIGLVVVLFAYLGVSLVIQISDQLQTGQIAAPDLSQNAQDDGALQPGGTTRATGRSSQDAAAPGARTNSATAAPAVEGSPAAACRSYYGADPATCSSGGGGCPVGVTDINGLISAWGRSFPAPSREIPEPAAACRTCLETGIRGSQGLYPGLTYSCVPALVNLWSTSCHDVCNPRSAESTERASTGQDICNTANYNTTNAGCARCMSYWSASSHAATVAEVACSRLDAKVAVWCAGAESPSRTSRPESGGYCTFTPTQR